MFSSIRQWQRHRITIYRGDRRRLVTRAQSDVDNTSPRVSAQVVVPQELVDTYFEFEHHNFIISVCNREWFKKHLHIHKLQFVAEVYYTQQHFQYNFLEINC